MRRGLDTNVLVHAHIPSLPDHTRVRSYLVEQLNHPEVTLVVTAGILHEFIHIVTDERRFAGAAPMKEAVALARLYLSHSNIECINSDGRSLTKALELIEQHQLGRKRIADTLFAATLLMHGVRELITCDQNDFKIFEGLALIDPKTSAVT